jgi:ABC-type multidrug transport system fused ATPase/permease subunit
MASSTPNPGPKGPDATAQGGPLPALPGEDAETPQVKKRLDRDSLATMRKVWRFMTPYRAWFWLGMVALVLSTLTVLVVPQLAGDLINVATGAEPLIPGDIGTLGWIFVGILLVQASLSFLRIYTFAQVSERSLSDIRRALYHRMLGLPLPFYEKRRVGELTSRITNDVTELQDLIANTLAEFLRQIATLVLGITALFIKSPKLTGLMLLIVPVAAILAMTFGRYIRRLARERQDALAESNVVVEETLQNIQTVKSFTAEHHEARRYGGFQDAVVRLAITAARYRAAFVSFIILAFLGGLGFIMWYGSTLIASGDMAAGDLVSFIIYTAFIGGSISGMVELYGKVLRSVGASDRIFDMLNESPEVELGLAEGVGMAEAIRQDRGRGAASSTASVHDSHELPEPAPLSGAVRLEGVRFAYPTRPDVTVLNGVDLAIAPGEKIALAGPSGAGKSTIAQLLLGYYPLQEGRVLYDGQPREHWGLRALRQRIAVVPQEVLLFGGSIRENIAYGKPDASDAEVEQAARQANAWNFIQQFPEGMATVVGERGIKLSGGQRQRIAIARAILKDPAILILDEATSSLDAESERLVQDALEKLMAHRTTLIIAHRLSTIRSVDRIHVLQDGKIAESGSYNELAAKDGGLFQHLLRLQFDQPERASV